MRKSAAVVVLASAVSFVHAGDLPQATATSTSSQVTLALPDYESMRDANERPSATVIDTIRMGGTFGARNLTISFSGRSVGRRPAANVFDIANDVTLS